MKYFLIYLFLSPLFCFAQKEDRVWVFDDSIAVDFNNISSPLVYNIGMNPQNLDENYASISDRNGNLLYYLAEGATYFGYGGLLRAIYGGNELIIPNGDSLGSDGSITQGAVFIPSLIDSNQTYLFYIVRNGANNSPVARGLYCAILDRLVDSFGICLEKNNVIISDTLTEKLTAVKHGNGRDWWILIHKDESKIFYKFLLSPSGVSGPYIQTIGPKLSSMSPGQMKFSPDGSKLGFVCQDKHVALFDFNRCTGLLSNYKNLGNSQTYGCSFSPSGNIFYTSTILSNNGVDSLFQYDLTSSNISMSKLLIWTENEDSFVIGQQLLAPDDKIYIVSSYSLLPNSVFDSANMNLTVITKPDVLGLGCNVEPYSFYLNGLKCRVGLPNMINYNLDTLHGSACDTLVSIGINEVVETSILNIYPNPVSDELTIEVLNGVKPKEIEIINVLGVTVMKLKQTKPNQQINIKSLSSGVYFIKVQMQNGDRVMKKFIKQ